MQAKAEKEYSLLKADSGIYGLYVYHSTWTSSSGPLNDPDSQRSNNIISGFKNRGHNFVLFSRRIKQVALLHGCTRIVAVPPHDLSQNNIQRLFPGDGIKRLKAGPKRKFMKNILNYKDFKITDTGERTLIVDDISTSGHTLQFFAKKFSEPVMFAIGVNAKQNPKTVRMIPDIDTEESIPETSKEKTESNKIQEVSDRVAFLAALKNGMGLTRGCTLIHQHPREWSKMILSDKEFYRECIEALKFSSKALLVMSNEFLQNKRFDRWLTQNEYIRNFHVELTTWECFRKRIEITDMDIITGFRIYKDLPELSTAIGFTETELIQHISTVEKLSIYFTDIKAI